MKNKQVKEVVLLSLALLVLIVLVMQTVKSMGKAAPPRPSAAPTPAAAPKPEQATNADALAWVKDSSRRVPYLLDEVRGGRNPFQDLRVPATAPSGKAADSAPAPTSTKRGTDHAAQHTGPASGTPTDHGGTLPDYPIAEPLITRIYTLEWTSLSAVKTACAQQGLGVEVKPGKHPGQLRIAGDASEVESAVGIIKSLDVPPPVPSFALSGVIVTPTERYAAITLDGKYYALLQGETIPDTGWIITRIAPTGVTLKKGKQSVQLPLSGGIPQ